MDKLTLINPKETKAILIGVSEFDDKSFVNAPPIKNNVNKLAELLQDKKILGLQQKDILILNENRRHDEILGLMDDFLKKDFTDTVIFYFAGHGYKTENGDFYLITKNTTKARIKLSSIPWEEIKEVLEKGNGIQQRLYILDACHSGAAALGEDDEETQIDEGSALIAAAKADEKAYFNTTDEFTHFTNALINVLENGVEEEELPELDTNLLYKYLESALKDKRFAITKKTTHKIDKVSFFKNKRFDKLSEKRRLILNLIQEGDQFLAKLDFEKAEHHYLKAERQAKSEEKFLAILQQLNDKIEKTENIRGYQKVFEAHYKSLLDRKAEELAQYQKSIEEYSKALATAKKEIQVLKKDKTEAEKELTSLKLNLKDAKDHVKQLQKEKEELVARLEKALPEKEADLNEQIDDVTFKMIAVEGGTFKMGSDEISYAKPVQDVTVPDFYMAELPVTQKLWQALTGNNPSKFKGEQNPVENVSWNDVQEFIHKLNTKTGRKYRLPFEAEWEYAARGGIKSNGYQYAGSNNIDEVAWYDKNSGKKTHPVGSKNPNELGLYDMSGNVWEWCQNDWHDNYEGAPKDGRAWGDGSGSSRVRRGGSWYDSAEGCRVSDRDNWIADFRDFDLGFRLAHSL